MLPSPEDHVAISNLLWLVLIVALVVAVLALL